MSNRDVYVKSARKSAKSEKLGLAFLRLFLSTADARGLDQGRQMRQGRAQAHKWVL